jgi:hypothetical protein
MKFFPLFALFFGTLPLFRLAASTAPDKEPDSLKVIHVHGKVLFANMGFAPVPAFSFNSPIAIGSLSIKKGRFRYDTDVSLGLNGKPWLNNNWFRYSLVSRKKIQLQAGIDGFLYFYSDQSASGEELLKVQRNLNLELSANFVVGDQSSFQLTLWHIIGYDPGALSGNVFDLGFSPPSVGIGKMLLLDLKPHIFYFNFTGPIDGLYASVTTNISHQKIPLSVCVQCVQPLWTGFPGNHFKANGGLVYTF